MSWKIIAISLIFIFIYGCSEKIPSTQSLIIKDDTENVEQPDNGNIDLNLSNIIGGNQPGMILGLTDNSSINEKQTIHKIEPGGTYRPNVYIKNNLPKKYTYRIFFFRNYKQEKVIIDKENLDYIDLHLESGDDRTLNVQFTSIEEGLNDILIIAVRDPENYLNKLQYIDSSQVYLSRRVALISENDKIPSIDYFPIIAGNIDEKEIYTDPFISLKNNDFMSSLMTKTEISNAALSMGTKEVNNKFAIISIMGTQQISLNDNDFIEVKKTGNFDMPIHYKFNNSKSQNVIIATIENPFTLDESLLLIEGVKFTNLITISP